MRRELRCSDSAYLQFLVALACKLGYLDKTGQMVIAPQYDGADAFSEGLAHLRVGDKSSYVDKTAKYVGRQQSKVFARLRDTNTPYERNTFDWPGRSR